MKYKGKKMKPHRVKQLQKAKNNPNNRLKMYLHPAEVKFWKEWGLFD